jgi:hypothetical protein
MTVRAFFKRLMMPVALLMCLATSPANASCTSPAGNEANVIYNEDYHTYQFCNGTSWISEGAAGGSGWPVLISTQTASNSASLQFTNLPTGYNTLFLNCQGLITSVDQVGVSLEVGEGATPTWETSGSYQVGSYQAGGGNFQNDSSSSATGTASTNSSNVYPASIKAYIGNVGSSSIYKNIDYEGDSWYSGISAFFHFGGSGFWSADTNPITGLEVIPGSGNITSGTCSLYGMN